MAFYPSVEDIIEAHKVIDEQFGVRTKGFRKSPEDTVQELQKVIEKAREQEDIYLSSAVYLTEIIDKHVFQDGNKRTAVIVTEDFLRRNGKEFTARKTQKPEEVHQQIKWEVKFLDIEEAAHWIRTGEIDGD